MTEIVISPAGTRPEGTRPEGTRPEGSRADVESEARPDGHAPRESAARDGAARDGQRRGMDPLFGVRTADIEPYTGLRYLSKLFRMIAVVLVLLLVAEVVTGLVHDGTEALSTLLAEVSRLIVLAGLLWGVGDLAILLIDVGHDVRAARILVGRQTAHLSHHAHEAQVIGPPAIVPAVASAAAPVVTPVTPVGAPTVAAAGAAASTAAAAH